MYRSVKRPLSCFLVAGFLIVGAIAATIVASIVHLVIPESLTSPVDLISLLIVMPTVFFLLQRRFQPVDRIPICPHCGVDTDPRFRICRACGRVKHTS